MPTTLPHRVERHGTAARDVRTRLLVARMRKIHAAAPAPAAPPSVAGLENLAGLRATRAVVIAPHADDEVIGCGGLLWHLAERGAATSVVFLTREAKRSIATPSMLAGIPRRVHEARNAQRHLGYDVGEHVGLDERFLPESDARLRGAVAPRLVTARPDLVLVPNYYEMHPDHRAAARATLLVTHALWEVGALPDLRAVLLYEIWGVCPSVDGYFALPGPAVDAVRAALACYETQTATVDYLSLLAELRESRAHALGRPAAQTPPNDPPAAASCRCWVEAYQMLRSPAEVAAYLATADRAAFPATSEARDVEGHDAL
jgi:LmbE family N-acetylglucosaminyl deacetylase